MSRRPIVLSADLQRLQNEGYDLEIREGFLLIKDIPYVDSQRNIRRGILISNLKLAGEVTQKPDTHVCYWNGDHPCHIDGSKIVSIENSSPPLDLLPGLRADFTFSARADYRDYHHKMTTYIGRIFGEVDVLDSAVTACTFPVIPEEEEDTIFIYTDTATSRAGIGVVNSKLKGLLVGIIGLGGTGSYILDFVAKTGVKEIHVFDGDVFSQHNAFRSPGAPSIDELRMKPHKVARFKEIYSKMHRGVVVHDIFLNPENMVLLDGLNFVFICMDVGTIKRMVIDRLVKNGIPFVDAGMGILSNDSMLGGIVRVTLSRPDRRDDATPHISFAEEGVGGKEYSSNIQIAEMNALNAAMAVILWKKFYGVYRDSDGQIYAGFSIGNGIMVSE